MTRTWMEVDNRIKPLGRACGRIGIENKIVVSGDL